MTTINIRIDEKTKKAAAKTLQEIGLDMSSAVTMFLRQVIAERGLPFRPTKSPAALRAQWDREIAEARKTGATYETAEELFKNLGIQ